MTLTAESCSQQQETENTSHKLGTGRLSIQFVNAPISFPNYNLLHRSQTTWEWLLTHRNNVKRSGHMSCWRGRSNSSRYRPVQ